MTTNRLDLQVISGNALSPQRKDEIILLCNRAYEEDLTGLFATFTDATHILGYTDGLLISHALWVTRYLQAGTGPLMRTAYVEMLATDLAYRGRGFAAAIMRRIIDEVQGYNLAALSPFGREYYQRLGWELWQGPLWIRMGDTLLASPPEDEEEVMIYRLPRTPTLDLTLSLSAEWREGELW